MDFVIEIYKITNDFPKDEKYGLISQIPKAAISILSNISEGAARKSTKEFIQFLYHSLGSATEIETQLEISNKLGYVNNVDDSLQRLKKIIYLLKYSIN